MDWSEIERETAERLSRETEKAERSENYAAAQKAHRAAVERGDFDADPNCESEEEGYED